MPATPSVTSPFSITPLFSKWSSTSRTVDSGASGTWSATVGSTGFVRARAMSLLHEGIGRPRARHRHAVAVARERLRRARDERLKRVGAPARDEERRVEQERTTFHRQLARG